MKYQIDNISAPWLDSYGGVNPHLDYSEKTISEDYLFNYLLFNKANYIQYL